MANEPYEIFLAPAEVYAAPVGEAWPDVDVAPTGNWLRIGTLGADNISEEGVTLRRPLTHHLIRTLGSTAPRKASVSETGFEVEFTVMDMNADFYALALGGVPADAVATPAGGGSPGIETVALPDRIQPIQRAILVRTDQSPSGDGFQTQWQIYAAVQVGSAEQVFSKSAALGTRHMWTAIKVTDGFVEYVTQTSAAS